MVAMVAETWNGSRS